MEYLIGVTHSDRPLDLSRCTTEAFIQRFGSPGRLDHLPLFDSLTPARSHSPYHGGATFWAFDTKKPEKPRLLHYFKPDYRVQHAVGLGDGFLLGATDSVEFIDPDGRVRWRASDPWMAGLHTLFHHKGRIAVSCSSSDAVLVLDAKDGKVTHALRLPPGLYGHGYDLSRDHDVREHYITNDHQFTHVNAAWPCNDGIYVCTLIQGAVGLFGWDASYRELFRASVGCHGIRCIGEDALLLADSCAGQARLFTLGGRLRSSTDFRCRWLHDVDVVSDRYMLGAIADRNSIAVADVHDGNILSEWPMQAFGTGVQFLSVAAIS